MIDMTYTDPLRYNREVPLRRANKNRATQKHETPLKIASPEKMIGRSHINEFESSAPAMGDPTRPPRPVKVKQTPNRAPISESFFAVDPTTGASRPIYDPEKNP